MHPERRLQRVRNRQTDVSELQQSDPSQIDTLHQRQDSGSEARLIIKNFKRTCRFAHLPFDLAVEAQIQMKYMLLVYLEERALSDTERQHCYIESAQLASELNDKGKYVSAGPLHPVSMATSVRVRNGKRLVTDGPFAETREQLGGYYLIDANDLDEAMSIAERIPVARVGTIEIRPVLEITGLPAQ